MSSQQDTSPKRAWVGTLKMDFSPLPTIKPCPLYLWPTTSPCPVLARYRLVVFGPCACLPSMCVQNLPAGRSLAVVWRLTCIVCRPFLLTFYVSCFLISRSHEELGFIWYWVLHFFWPISWLPSFPAILLFHSCCNDSIMLGLFRPAVYSFPQWFGMTIGFPTYGLLCPFCLPLGHSWLICFLWAFLALLLTPHSYGLLLTLLGFPSPITLFSSLGFMSLPLTPYFLCLHYFRAAVALSHFSTSYTAHGYAISLFLSFFKPTCLFKIHLFISRVYDSLFLPLRPNSFAICLPILCCSCRWAFFFLLEFS